MISRFESTKSSFEPVVSEPNWYEQLQIIPDRKRSLAIVAFAALQAKPPLTAISAERDIRYDALGALLAEGKVRLGDPARDRELPNWDEDRQNIDTVVVHHTNRPGGLTNERLNAMELARLYIPRYLSDSTDPYVKGQPIYSGHFDSKGRQVFYPYHWIIRQNGDAERLLDDNAVGWHAGNWDVNKRSVAICFDDDLANKPPTDASLETARDILRDNYQKTQLIGHRQVNSATECPGNAFLGDDGWGNTLRVR